MPHQFLNQFIINKLSNNKLFFVFSEFHSTVPVSLVFNRHTNIHPPSMPRSEAIGGGRRHVEGVAALPRRRHRVARRPGDHRHLQYSRGLLDVRLLQVRINSKILFSKFSIV